MNAPAALLLALTLATPLAAADQDLEIGPVYVETWNTEQGAACGEGDGYHFRAAELTVEAIEGDVVGAYFYQHCSDQTFVGGSNHGNGTFLTVDRRVDGNNIGPQVYVGQSDNTFVFGESEQRMCSTYAGVLGVPLSFGCYPSVPMVPMMP